MEEVEKRLRERFGDRFDLQGVLDLWKRFRRSNEIVIDAMTQLGHNLQQVAEAGMLNLDPEQVKALRLQIKRARGKLRYIRRYRRTGERRR